MAAGLESRPSYFWKSLMLGKEVLSRGICWQVGDGSFIRVFKDPWLALLHTFKPITKITSTNAELRVADLIDASTRDWNESALTRHLWPIDLKYVRGIVLGFHQQADHQI